ncbi:hypothetical protein MJC1_03516 [Methylocystis sp. MJC1]|uniref:acyltransferase family protein n=1 Tax=Methylocystis sp. MJC1 TaxID=2654282 RepID=UPI0013EBFA34|nr:acyltransferase family protein [Methylocystis sp. MJC1]KAF2989366.1 hypothetical protein MJC1_03516 [Methylocystis sp. MJC1]MBU6526883.1 acyltransferase [Methylocystis sp. MJC1]
MRLEPRLSNFLDGGRWLFAFIVLIGHETPLFNRFGGMMITPQSTTNYIWWFFSHFQFAHFAVIGFFVISGFLVGGNALTAILQDKAFLKSYLINRVTRIYVVLIPALLVTFTFDTLGRALFRKSFYEHSLFDGHFGLNLIPPNLLNLQEIYSPFYGTSAPLWSLACEFWSYIVFPLLLLPLHRGLSWRAKAAAFTAGVALFAALCAPQTLFAFYFLIWVMGAIARIVTRPLLKSPNLALALLIVSVVVTRLTVRGPALAAVPQLQQFADVLNAFLFANVIVALRFNSSPFRDGGVAEINRKLADFSYSLYAVHNAVVFFGACAIRYFAGEEWMPDDSAGPLHIFAFACLTGLVMAFAYGFSRLTEARTEDARRALRSLVDRVTATHGRRIADKMAARETVL